jgi:cytochrome c oxidase subunit 1
MVFFVLTAALSGTFSNLLIPLQIGARDMAGFMNMLSYWLFFSLIMISSLFAGLRSGWTIYPLSALPQAIGGSGLGMTLWLVNGYFHCIVLNGIVELYSYGNQFEDRGVLTRLPYLSGLSLLAIIGVVSFLLLLSAAVIDFLIEVSVLFFLSDIYIAGEVLHYQGGSPVLFEHLFWFLVIQRCISYCCRPVLHQK